MKMTNKLKKLSIVLVFAMIISVVQIAATSVASAATGPNLVVNGDFEAYGSDWKATNWTFSSGNVSFGNDLGRTGKALDITATGTAGIQTVTQSIYGLNGNRLPDGVYTLEAYVKGGADISYLNSVALGVTNTGITNVTSSDIAASSISSTEYTNIKLENVKVSNGSCNIVVSVNMDSGDWKKALSLDDVSFYKTGEINYVQNGSFEGDGSGSPAGWDISSTAATQWTGNWGSGGETSYCMQLWNSTAYTGTVTQAATVTPGVYTLKALVKGGSYNVVKLVAGSASVNVSETASFTEVTLSDITVTSAGSIDIGFNVDMADGGWVNIDDVSLFKTRGLNTVQNSDFETGWGDGWTTSAPGITCNVKQEWDHTSGSGKKVNISAWGVDGTHEVSISQNVTNIQEGVYNLVVWVAGGGSSVNSLTLTAGDISSSDLKGSIVGNGYTKLELNGIAVNSTSCAIGVSSQLVGSVADGGWINIDDFDFYKVREIGDVIPEITSIMGLTQNLEVNGNPLDIFPAKVTVTYDTGATASVNVTWNTVASTQYSGKDTIGTSFVVEGTVANTDVKATTTITVTYKAMDLNSNSEINVGDLAFASYYFNATPTSSNWVTAIKADINGDLVINIDDLNLITSEVIK